MLLALRIGDLSIVSALTALYPAGTILLAAIVLRERVAAVQWAGLALALSPAGMLALALTACAALAVSRATNSRTHDTTSATTPRPMRPAASSATARTSGDRWVSRMRLLQPRREKMSDIPASPTSVILLVDEWRLVDAAVLVEPAHHPAVLGRLDDGAHRHPGAVEEIGDQRDTGQQRAGAESHPGEDLDDGVDRCVHVADPPLSIGDPDDVRGPPKRASEFRLSHLRESNP